MVKKTLTMLGMGDLLLFKKINPAGLFDSISPVLKSADIVVGQGEGAYTTRPHITCAQGGGAEMIPGRTGDPAVFRDVKEAGFNVLTLANNHAWDGGIPGIEDWLTELRSLGIATVGLGMNIDEARRPAIIERGGTRIGFLNYNCAGPKVTWANAQKPGCAYVHVLTVYEMENPGPGESPTATYTVAELGSLQAMADDIRKLRPLCDVLVVKLHKGVAFVPARLAQYEQQICYAAVDAGADLILADHAHLLKGIEVYKGKPIYHGLNHFAMTFPGTPITNPEILQKMTATHKAQHGIEVDPETMKYMYQTRDSLKTIIAKCTITNGKITRSGFLPCLINMEKDRPELLKHDARGQEIFDYMDRITREAGLNARYEWDGDEIIITS
jgi:hypothetical protein